MSDFTDKMAELQEMVEPGGGHLLGRLWRVFMAIIYLLLDLHARVCELEERNQDG